MFQLYSSTFLTNSLLLASPASCVSKVDLKLYSVLSFLTQLRTFSKSDWISLQSLMIGVSRLRRASAPPRHPSRQVPGLTSLGITGSFVLVKQASALARLGPSQIHLCFHLVPLLQPKRPFPPSLGPSSCDSVRERQMA